MNEIRLPAHVNDFVIRYITSVEQLELLLLFASTPTKNWTVQELVTIFRSSDASVRQRVKKLLDQGFLVSEGEILRFAPAAAERKAACHDLAIAYQNYRVRIIELIYSGSGPLKSFSDAFKFKPEK